MRLGQITDALERELLFELLGPVAGKTLLDVGCGDGAFASGLSQRGAAVTGVDPDPAMIGAARRRAEKEDVQLWLVEGKSEALPFRDGELDYVLAVTVLCFVPDAKLAIAEIARVLKPGGQLIIGELGSASLWAGYRRVRGWLGHPSWRAARFRSPAELRRLVVGAGLSVLEMRGAAIRHAEWRRSCLPLSICGSGGEQPSERLLSPHRQRSQSTRTKSHKAIK